jgi:hypothetical protein
MIRRLRTDLVGFLNYIGVLGVLLFILFFGVVVIVFVSSLHVRNAPCEELMYLTVKDLPARCLVELNKAK